jgi:hypothetical protein
MWDTAGLSLKPVAGPTTPYGYPMFAPAYVGRKRWAKSVDRISFRPKMDAPFLRSTVSNSPLHHNLLDMAGVLKRIAIENNHICILTFA